MVEIPHFVQTIAEKKMKSKSFTLENEKNDPAKRKKNIGFPNGPFFRYGNFFIPRVAKILKN